MATTFEKYGSGVVGLPFLVRVTLTAMLVVPTVFWAWVGLHLAMPVGAFAFLMAFCFAVPAYLFVPGFWERTEESVRTDWRSHRLQRWLELELGTREQAPRALADPERPMPRRW